MLIHYEIMCAHLWGDLSIYGNFNSFGHLDSLWESPLGDMELKFDYIVKDRRQNLKPQRSSSGLPIGWLDMIRKSPPSCLTEWNIFLSDIFYLLSLFSFYLTAYHRGGHVGLPVSDTTSAQRGIRPTMLPSCVSEHAVQWKRLHLL